MKNLVVILPLLFFLATPSGSSPPPPQPQSKTKPGGPEKWGGWRIFILSAKVYILPGNDAGTLVHSYYVWCYLALSHHASTLYLKGRSLVNRILFYSPSFPSFPRKQKNISALLFSTRQPQLRQQPRCLREGHRGGRLPQGHHGGAQGAHEHVRPSPQNEE